jgi:UDP-3-O-[3-hydroxymyristoyl] glucosamine N-acyltransferase
MAALTIAQIAEICGASVEGNSGGIILSANTLEQASEKDLAFAENPKHFQAAAESAAGCLLVPSNFERQARGTIIRVSEPRTAFAKAVAVLYLEVPPPVSIHATAIIDESANIVANCHVGAYTTIGAASSIGAGCWIAAGCRIGANVSIGAGSKLHPNVTIYDNVRLGQRVILHSGCVLGADGFGYSFAGDHYEKFPQVGSVEIGDDVEIGANSCVDRAALGVTRIGAGTKLDNLVHVAHNCMFGKHVAVAAQAGFSGSVTVGDYAVIGGQAGIGEKVKIDAKAVIGGKSGVLTGRRIEAGEPVWGIPARPLRQHLKNLAYIAKLPQTRDEIDALQQRMAVLEDSNAQRHGEAKES